jgi:hypothetical protein
MTATCWCTTVYVLCLCLFLYVLTVPDLSYDAERLEIYL